MILEEQDGGCGEEEKTPPKRMDVVLLSYKKDK